MSQDNDQRVADLVRENEALKRHIVELEGKLHSLHEVLAEAGGGPTLPERLFGTSRRRFFGWLR